MKTRTFLITAAAAAALGTAGYGLYAWGMQRGMGLASGAATAQLDAPLGVPQGIAAGEDATRRHISAGLKAGDVDPGTGQKILYYHDPMVPGNKFDRPAKSPFMDMMLVPVYAGGEADAGRVSVSPRVQQNLGVRTATVAEGMLSPQVTAVGNIAWNERDQVVVQARATGFVERLHVRATLDRVKAGQALAEIYVPDWIAAQEEFLAVRRLQGSDLTALVDGARQRMRQVGMSEPQIARVESSGRTQARLTLVAPIGGVVTELLLREGMTVSAGATLVRIQGTAVVWANAEVPESQVSVLQPGTPVRATSPAAPGVTFDGKVQAILPEVNTGTRTLKARVELKNAGLRLVPGMSVQMQFTEPRTARALLVPSEAVIRTGTRAVVMLAEDDGRFRPVEVEPGLESGGQTEIRRGLQAGQRIVVSAQFLLDSEASLKGFEARSAVPAAPPAVAASAAARHQGQARVERIGTDALTLTHGPIPSIRWGEMTMDFKLPPGGLPNALPKGLAEGDTVDFEFTMDAQSQPQLSAVTRAAAQPKAPASGSRP